jgi:flagellar biosynthesis protein FlhG
MFHGIDQASGLRKLFRSRRIEVIPAVPVNGCADVTRFSVNLAAAMTHAGRRVLVLDALRGVAPSIGLKARHDLIHVLQDEASFEAAIVRSTDGFVVLPAARGLAFAMDEGIRPEWLFEWLARRPPQFDTIVLCASAEIAAGLLSERSDALAVVSGSRMDQLASTYARLKALYLGYGISAFGLVLHRAQDPLGAQAFAERLCDTASKFLGVRVELACMVLDDPAFEMKNPVGCGITRLAPSSAPAIAFRRLAEESDRLWPVRFDSGSFSEGGTGRHTGLRVAIDHRSNGKETVQPT